MSVSSIAATTGGLDNALAPSVQVVSYNVLSSELTRDFSACRQEDLRADVRLRRVLAKLETAVDQGAVVCLQEVSIAWAGPIHLFFAKHGYHVVLDLYGNFYSGYMGVALAYPTNRLQVDDIRIQKVSAVKRWPRTSKPTGWRSWLAKAGALWRTIRRTKKEDDEWQIAKSRHNSTIFAKFTDKASNLPFCVATYHMPCLYRVPAVMVIHSALLAQFVHQAAEDVPYVIAGDFNIKPGDSSYRLLTTGKLDESDPTYPRSRDKEPWRPVVGQPLESAYAAVNGTEPEYTNHSKFDGSPEFIDCLDYLFASPGLQPTEVLPLPPLSSAKHPQPTKKEPSDHLMIGARFRLLK